MNFAGRLFMDVSYTRTQHGNVGITRTVRRLLGELEASVNCKPVVFHRSGFRLLRSGQGTVTAPGVEVVDTAAARLFRILNSGPIRKLVSLIPKPVLHRVWRLNNDLTFDSLSRTEESLAFQGGDYLLMADQSWNYRAWLAAQHARAQGATVVLVLYDLIPIRHPEFCPPLFNEVFRIWLLRMLGCCDLVMCISESTEADLIAWCEEERLALPRTSHFRLGCDLPKESGGEVRVALSRFMQSSVPIFAAVGTIEPRKNYSTLLRTFERLWRADVAAHLLIAGRATAEEREFVERLRRHPQQGAKLLTLFDATDQELAHVYAHARALVLPSLAEGFGLPLVEARARGCLVIASDIQAFKELADQGVSFFPRHSEERLAELIADHVSLQKENCPQSQLCVTWNQSSLELLRLLEGTA